MKLFLRKHRIVLTAAGIFLALCVLFATACNLIVIGVAHQYRTEVSALQKEHARYDCILVLGAGIRQDGTPSNLLRDRLDMGLTLLSLGCADKLLLTGDSEDAAVYDEVGSMADYAVQAGVSNTQILRDPLGLSTYESLYRAKYVYGMERVLIVTQNFHLSRALYLANALGLECAGVACDVTASLPANHIREFAARCKALFDGLFLPEVPNFSEIQKERDLTV